MWSYDRRYSIIGTLSTFFDLNVTYSTKGWLVPTCFFDLSRCGEAKMRMHVELEGASECASEKPPKWCEDHPEGKKRAPLHYRRR